MSIENLYPFAGDHAVQNATFVLEWSDPVGESVIVEASKLATKFKNLGLAHHSLRSHIELKFDGQVEAPDVQKRSGPGSIIFSQEKDPVNPGRAVTLSRQNLLIAIPDYTRWDKVFADVEKYLKIILEEVAPSRPINVIALQYVDVFSWKDDPSELDLSEVFNPDSYVPKHIFSLKSLWHLHQGYVSENIGSLPYSLIENVNLDTADVNGVRVIQITSVHRATLKDPMWQAHMKNKEKVNETFASLHQTNKVMLQRLLTQQVCEKINLNISERSQ